MTKSVSEVVNIFSIILLFIFIMENKLKKLQLRLISKHTTGMSNLTNNAFKKAGILFIIVKFGAFISLLERIKLPQQ